MLYTFCTLCTSVVLAEIDRYSAVILLLLRVYTNTCYFLSEHTVFMVTQLGLDIFIYLCRLYLHFQESIKPPILIIVHIVREAVTGIISGPLKCMTCHDSGTNKTHSGLLISSAVYHPSKQKHSARSFHELHIAT